HPPADPQGTISSIFAIASAEAKPVQVRVASSAPDWSGMGAFFGNLFGSKRDNTSPSVRESSGAQPVKEKKIQAALIRPGAVPAQTKVTVASQGTLEAQRTTDASIAQKEGSAELPADAGGARATNLLTGAVPTVPAGGFQNRFGRQSD